jgi:creatinine amidohydrolase
MPASLWVDCTREQLGELAAQAVAVLPVGAVEQHGPYLPTGTDAAIVTEVCRRACALVEPDVIAVLLPTVPFGSSDHHLPFGGTLSLRQETLAMVLADLLRSLRSSGFERVLVVNGHGGNVEICGAAVKRAANALDVLAATVSYWDLLPAAPDVPGHAGAFEASVMSVLAADRMPRDDMRPSPAAVPASPPGVVVEDPRVWRAIGGYTDDPGALSPKRGEEALRTAAGALADVLRVLADRPR